LKNRERTLEFTKKALSEKYFFGKRFHCRERVDTPILDAQTPSRTEFTAPLRSMIETSKAQSEKKNTSAYGCGSD
jgi:hypothetical protein